MQLTKPEVESIVESWNWNLSIFEIYDEVRDMASWDKMELLNYAYKFFNQDKMIKELAHFLNVDIDEEI